MGFMSIGVVVTKIMIFFKNCVHVDGPRIENSWLSVLKFVEIRFCTSLLSIAKKVPFCTQHRTVLNF